MRTKRPSGLASPSGLLRLVGDAAMGMAMGLAFAMLLMLIDPAGVALAGRGGWQIMRFFGPLILTFGIGATLTGVVFVVAEKSDSGNS
jgi:hypothetical protein